MSLKRRSTVKEKTEYDKLPDGEYEARLVYVADLGLQDRSRYDKEPAQQVSLGLEILGQPVTINEVECPRILWSQSFNVFQTMHEKSKELQMYRIFNPSAAPDTVADWDSVLGMPCNAVVGKREGNNGKVYDELTNITTIPAKYHDSIAKGEIEPCIGDADDPDNAAQTNLFGLAKWKYDNRIEDTEF